MTPVRIMGVYNHLSYILFQKAFMKGIFTEQKYVRKDHGICGARNGRSRSSGWF